MKATKKFKFGKDSQRNLDEAHPLLQELFNEVIRYVDCSVIEGHRSEKEQNKFFKMGLSKLKYPKSKHNKKPSLAVDVIPYPCDWKDREQFSYFAGIVLGIAASKGINIRWGGDFNTNHDIGDDRFYDAPHFELVGVKRCKL